MKKLILPALGLILFFAAPAMAQTELSSSSYQECKQSANGQIEAMTVCTKAEDKRLDEVLNVSYNKLAAGLSAENKDRLKAAQRSWLKTLEADTTYIISKNSGNLSSALEANEYRFAEIARRVDFFNKEIATVPEKPVTKDKK